MYFRVIIHLLTSVVMETYNNMPQRKNPYCHELRIPIRVFLCEFMLALRVKRRSLHLL